MLLAPFVSELKAAGGWFPADLDWSHLYLGQAEKPEEQRKRTEASRVTRITQSHDLPRCERTGLCHIRIAEGTAKPTAAHVSEVNPGTTQPGAKIEILAKGRMP